MFKILILEDDAILAASLEALLEDEGYEIHIAKDGNEALELSFAESFDMFLLDVNVPFLNGFDFLKQLRESGDETPAFFITALHDTASLSKGFDAGCDDYIKKPFDFDELLIRLNAKLSLKSHILDYKNIKFNIKTNQVTKDGLALQMQQVQKQILLHFLKNSGKIVDKNTLFELMEKPTDLALRVHISKIKKLLGLKIINIRSHGYQLEKA
jgi:DNA-binding response OmpR family regulator